MHAPRMMRACRATPMMRLEMRHAYLIALRAMRRFCRCLFTRSCRISTSPARCPVDFALFAATPLPDIAAPLPSPPRRCSLLCKENARAMPHAMRRDASSAAQACRVVPDARLSQHAARTPIRYLMFRDIRRRSRVTFASLMPTPMPDASRRRTMF